MKRRHVSIRCVGTPSRLRGRTGFSLLELLITVVIILILFTLYWSPSSASRQRALKTSCQKNLQKLHIALEIYANEHAGQFPATKGARVSEEPLDLLVPRYTSDTSFLTCPGSKDSELPGGSALRGRKISYAYYMGRWLTNSPSPLVSDKQIDTVTRAAGEPAFSTTGKPPGNNHRKFGGNFLFTDGHIESTPAQVPFSLSLAPGEVLLNP